MIEKIRELAVLFAIFIGALFVTVAILAALVLSISAFADVAKAFSIKTSSSCPISVSGGSDIDNPSLYGSGRFIAVKEGCTAKIYDITTGEAVYQLDLEAVGLNTESIYSSITFYRNLTSAAGTWSAVYYDADYSATPVYKVGIVDGGKMQMLSTTCTTIPVLDLYGGVLYAILTEPYGKDFYVLRNGVSTQSAPLLKQVNRDHQRSVLWTEVNPAGQRMDSHNTPRNLEFLRK